MCAFRRSHRSGWAAPCCISRWRSSLSAWRRTLASSHSAFVALFVVVLPVLVYAFLSTIWMLKLAQTALGVR